MPNVRWGTKNRGARICNQKGSAEPGGREGREKVETHVIYLPESSCLATWDIALLSSADVKEHDECSQV